MATLLSRVEHKLSRTLHGQASRALSSQRKSVSHSDWWTLGQGHLARPRSLVSRSRAAVPVLTPRRSINLVVGGTHILDTPTQHTVYHRGNHKVIDVTNAVIEGDKEDIHREAWRLVNAMADAARAAGANVLMTEVKVFDGKATTSTGAISPPGFASVVLLDESHLSAHCYAKTGLLAIDCFTCGSDPDATDQIVLKVEKLVREMFPAASLEIQSMRRFGHFDIPRYIEEYYCSLGEEPLGVDNQNLLKFHHRAWKKVNERTGGKKVSVLELGGGPTIYQLLSASRYAGSVYFTDLLQTNVDYVRQYKTGQQATDWPMHDWTAFGKFVSDLEAADGMESTTQDPVARLSPLMTRFGRLDVSTRSNDVDESFDVVSAHFVFEASADPTSTHAWTEHLENGSRMVAPGGHLVMTTLLSQTGMVMEDGRVLPTSRVTAQLVRDSLDSAGFVDVEIDIIESEDVERGLEQFAGVVARKPDSAALTLAQSNTAVANFMRKNFRHFNAAALVEAAEGYKALIEKDGKMFLTLAGAMSTAEIGVSLAEMIRQGKVHGLSVTGANLEEDFFNMIAHNSYTRIPDWRGLTKDMEQELYDAGMNRVTDTCIPEDVAFRRVEHALVDLYNEAEAAGEKLAPHELFYRLIRRGTLAHHYEIDPKDSWLVAAAEADLPIVCPGWEDSTCGNIIVANKIEGKIKGYPIKSGLEQMESLCDWYLKTQEHHDIGFFQIGGGIAGDYSVCSVPLIRQDLERDDVKLWSYFAQISDGTTSYGGYSAAPPNEKITWGKVGPKTPTYIVESDATICWPLLTSIVLSSE